jgi:hypothetical protein
MVTTNYPTPPVIWSRPRAGGVWHARRSFLDAAALCRFAARTGWVGAAEVRPATDRVCATCAVRALDVLAARATGAGGRR